MSGLLDRAKRWLQRDETAETPSSQSFSVVCSQGHRLHGQRNAGYQALRCPTCGAAVFVLPASPLPEPRAPLSHSRPSATAAPRTPASPRNWNDPIPAAFGYEPVALSDPPLDPGDNPLVGLPPAASHPPAGRRDHAPPRETYIEVADDAPVDGAVEWADVDPLAAGPDPAAAPPSHSKSRPTDLPGRPAVKPTRKPLKAAAAGPAQPRPRVQIDAEAGRVVIADEPRSSFLDRLNRRRNPLIFLGVTAVVIATATLRFERARRAEAPALAERGRTQGLRALDEGRFVDAYQILSRAAAAVDILDGKVEGADEIRQAAREAALLNDLTPDPLETILDAASRAPPETWDARFASDYKGRSIVLEAGVVSARDPDSENSIDLDYRIYPNGEGSRPPAVARLDLKGFRLFELAGTKPGSRVVFAARLASLRFDPAREEWRVGLEPDSGAFITHSLALETLGWPGTDERTETEDRS